MARVKEYLDYLEKKLDSRIFREECRVGFSNIRNQFGDMETRETIQEIHLSKPEKECDYSIKVDLPKTEKLREYWLELDDDSCQKQEIVPCLFVDAGMLRPGEDNDWFFEQILSKLVGKAVNKQLISMIRKCIDELRGYASCLFQVGVMRGRGSESVRLFTDDMKAESMLAYLEKLNWDGSASSLKALLEELKAHVEKQNFILDFDVTEQGISKKIGINFGSRNKSVPVIEELLLFFEKKNLCIPEKREAVISWIQRFPSHTPFIQNDISHFKVPFDGETALDAKAYLRQGSVSYVEASVFESPYIMNLELTTRCPLACPQCYCSLEGGMDLDLKEAVHWADQAQKYGVGVINLSGGETMCYPHLYELIENISKRGIEANVAVSGAHFGKEEAKRLIQAGVRDICVSLNAPDEKTNALTRGGFALAIKALEILRDMEFSGTCINWVMHSNNSGCFKEMLDLAEAYHVKTVAVMVFKPDAKHQRNSFPSAEQIRAVASVIKNYQGSVEIEVESCFSQMKALLGEKFFINTNRGIQRGCGAGRDAVSVSADGKITPCRHLEVKEDYRDLEEYWTHSDFLRQLRCAEEAMEEPCSHCKYRKNCLPCMAVNWKINNRIYMGEEACLLWK